MPRSSVKAVCAALCVPLAGSVLIEQDWVLQQPPSPEELKGHRFTSFLQQDAKPKDKPKFNCTRFPEACKPPFNCHLGPKEIGEGKLTVSTPEGHADYQTWCDMPFYVEAAMACSKGDLRGYGRLMHESQNNMSRVIQGIDAHYCFAFGHCDNEDIGPTATLSTMEAKCDERFGHETWTKQTHVAFSIRDVKITLGNGVYMTGNTIQSFAMAACGMGNFHCDAVYCKQEYCGQKKWRAMYGDKRPEAGKAAHHEDYPRNF
eukprot:CAMPEP_0171239720 /NCGR_PEP_ID=MMETSP0790-20130122/44118_1 /TAXON_ID=2925 /ORGANISM="Alexandrium catenella, Strain OF101" /LENGTH=259 /DNA_ID=CAMNT_0011706093 /DNA_START=37 /DNA_END=816 /DNA_ORIENTATION=+